MNHVIGGCTLVPGYVNRAKKPSKSRCHLMSLGITNLDRQCHRHDYSNDTHLMTVCTAWHGMARHGTARHSSRALTSKCPCCSGGRRLSTAHHSPHTLSCIMFQSSPQARYGVQGCAKVIGHSRMLQTTNLHPRNQRPHYRRRHEDASVLDMAIIIQ